VLHRRLLLGLALAAAQLVPAHAAHDLDPVVADLTEAYEDWRDLRELGQVEFTSSAAELRYSRAMRRLRRAIRELQDGEEPGENFRPQAVMAIRRNVHSAYHSACIAQLPSFLTEHDLHSSHVEEALGSYFLNPSEPSPRNRKGVAARGIVEHLHSSYVNDALQKLGAFVSQDDAAFVVFAADDLHSSYVAESLGAFFHHPSSSRTGNRKGSGGRVVLEEVHSSYRDECLRALPSYLGEGDLALLRELVDDTHSSQVAQAIRELFGT